METNIKKIQDTKLSNLLGGFALILGLISLFFGFYILILDEDKSKIIEKDKK